MTNKLTMSSSSQSKKRKRADTTIIQWTVFFLCFVSTLVIVSLIKAYLPLLVTTLAMLFIWSQITKPIAKIKPKATNDDTNQLNLFHPRFKITKRYSQVDEVLEKGIDQIGYKNANDSKASKEWRNFHNPYHRKREMSGVNTGNLKHMKKD